MAAVLIPAVILISTGASMGGDLGGVAMVLAILLGLISIGAGLALWLWTVRLFARVGKGTLAPWDPPRRLVIRGPYRHLRNPMITAVLAVLAGEAMMFGSAPLLIWCALFFGLNHAFFVLHEEPTLEQRFGDAYRAYKRNVPRWLPRLSAADVEADQSGELGDS
jgi:protein-S-isoprenylcysteine O-methyltransferase Ste14